MPTTAEKLARKNQEGLGLLLKLLGQLGMSYKEIAETLGVTPPLVTFWVQSKRHMSVKDQTWCYGTFVDSIMKRWPEGNIAKQRRLIPLMKQLAATWQEASELAVTEKDEAVDVLLKEYSALQKQQVLDVEGLYRFTTANENFQAMTQAKYEQKLTKDAWDTAQKVIAKAKKVLEADTPPMQRTRPRRKAQRRPRRRARAQT
jgi:transcriptional regulator with XRE-family HTH domain